MPERRAVGLTPAAVKASAGAIEHIKVARVVNMTRVIEMLKARNIWTYAQTIDERFLQTVFKGFGEILLVGFKNLLSFRLKKISQAQQSLVFFGC